MNKEKLATLNNKKIQFMIDNQLIDEYFSIQDIGNYLTTVYLDEYLVTEDTANIKKDIRKKRKNLIQIFQRMKKKFNFAYIVNKPLNVLVCINKKNSDYIFKLDSNNNYPRIVFTNYEYLDESNKIELNPEYYEPEILKKCIDSMTKIKSTRKFAIQLYEYIDIYKYVRNSLDIPAKVLTQLESRYMFYEKTVLKKQFGENKYKEISLDPYKNDVNKFISDEIYIVDEQIEFNEILEYLNINERKFYNQSQKKKSSEGMFRKELNYLKKHLTLFYMYKKKLYPYRINKNKVPEEFYIKELKNSIVENYQTLGLLYKLLLIPFKTYEVLDFYEEKYKKMFNYYKSQGYSKWQTQEIMRRYRYITEQMQLEPPEELLDMVDMFLSHFNYQNFKYKEDYKFFEQLNS